MIGTLYTKKLLIMKLYYKFTIILKDDSSKHYRYYELPSYKKAKEKQRELQNLEVVSRVFLARIDFDEYFKKRVEIVAKNEKPIELSPQKKRYTNYKGYSSRKKVTVPNDLYIRHAQYKGTDKILRALKHEHRVSEKQLNVLINYYKLDK